MIDVAYALKVDEARDQDRGMLSAWIARGNTDVDEITRQLASDGSVASFERALDEADPGPEVAADAEPEEIQQLSVDEYRAGITNMMEWAARVNGSRSS